MSGTLACGSCRSPIAVGDRFCSRCGAVLGGTEQVDPEGRKTVAVLFVDLVGSTTLAEQLDPEVIRGVLDRYYTVCADSVADHGGVVEKYIGDAIMAVFGVPANREDDALRAVRAAYAAVTGVERLTETVARHGIELRAHAGVGSGEVVVVATPGTHLRVIGDPVNTAARLQNAAGPGEIIVNAEVADLVGPYATLEPVAPLTLKGKAEPVPAWRVVSLVSATPSVDRTPLVGRGRELAELAGSFGAVAATGRGRRALISGPAGIGKSRLLREFLAQSNEPAGAVLTGACQPYGKDLTYQPLASMLRGSLVAPVDRLAGDDEAGKQTSRVLSTVLGDRAAADRVGVGAQDIALATATLLRTLAARSPLLVVWEDLQWAEPALLHLIDELAVRLADVPVMQVCVARGEINGWANGDWDHRLELGPLGTAETTQLVGALIGGGTEDEVQGQRAVVEPEVLDRIVATCEGNPLFATVMAETLAEDVSLANLPPTVTAVLRARIDALPPAERRVLQMAAVCGREFAAAQLSRIGEPGADIGAELAALCRRGLLHKATSGRYRFAQTLLHDTAYAALPKSQRARWHVALAGDPSALGEIYHSEAACLLFREITPDEPGLSALIARTVDLLIAEGTVALHRKDQNSAAALLGRALELAPPDAPERVVIVLRLSDGYLLAGDSARALSVLPDETAVGARTIELQRGIAAYRLGTLAPDAARGQVEAFRAELVREPDDQLGWCLLHQYAGFLALGGGRGGAAEEEFRQALERATALGDRYTQDRLLAALCELAQWSPTSVTDGLRLCEELTERFADDRLLLILVLATRARLLSLIGDFDTSYAVLETAQAYAADLHAALAEIAISQAEALVRTQAGEFAEAVRLLDLTARRLREHGHWVPARSLELIAVVQRLRDGQVVAAATSFGRLTAAADADGARDARDRTWTGLVEARLAAEDGRTEEAVRLSAATLAAIAIDDPCLLGEAWFEHALLVRRAGRAVEAVRAAARAEEYFRLKGATHPAAEVAAWVAVSERG